MKAQKFDETAGGTEIVQADFRETEENQCFILKSLNIAIVLYLRRTNKNYSEHFWWWIHFGSSTNKTFEKTFEQKPSMS